MRLIMLGGALFLAANACARADSPVGKRLVVHEWGVWKVRAGETLHLQELARENPSFVRQAAPIPEAAPMRPVRKPVLFFYATQPLHVDINVTLVGGYPVFHYPPGVAVGNALTFSLEVGPRGKLQPVAATHFWQRLRDVGASFVTANGETERFAFYDGPTRLDRDFTVRRDNETRKGPSRDLSPEGEPARRAAAFMPEPTALVVTRLTDEPVILTDGAHVALVTGAAGETRVAWPPTLPMTTLVTTLEARLLHSGLSTAETRAFIETWRPDLIAKGRRAIAVVSRARYDGMLPIVITPTPDELVRTGVIIDELE